MEVGQFCEDFGETRVGREVERFNAVERFRYFSPREAFRQDVDRAEKGRIAAIDDSSVRNFRRKESDASSVRSIQRAAEPARQINGVEFRDRRFRRFAKETQTGSNRADRELEAANVALRQTDGGKIGGVLRNLGDLRNLGIFGKRRRLRRVNVGALGGLGDFERSFSGDVGESAAKVGGQLGDFRSVGGSQATVRRDGVRR